MLVLFGVQILNNCMWLSF